MGDSDSGITLILAILESEMELESCYSEMLETEWESESKLPGIEINQKMESIPKLSEPVLSVFFAIGGSAGVHSRVRLRMSGPEPPYKARRVGAGGGKVASNSW